MYFNAKRNSFYVDFCVGGVRYHHTLDTANEELAKELEKQLKDQAKLDNIKKNREATQANTSASPFIPVWMRKSTMSLTLAFERICAEVWDHNKDSANPKIHVKRIIEIVGDIKDLREFNSSHVAEIVNTLKRDGLSGSTINKYLTSLFVIFNRAKDVWTPTVIENVISWKAFRQRKGKSRERVVSPKELDIMYDYFLENDHREMFLFVKILRNTGMRKGELHRIELRDIDIQRRELVSRVNKEGDNPKYIPLNTEAYEAVRELVGSRLKETGGDSVGTSVGTLSIHAIQSTNRTLLVSLSSNQTDHLWRMMKRYSKLKDCTDIVMHSLRHTFASDLINKGVSVYVVKELLGHSSVEVTNVYTHVSNSTLHAAVNR